MRAFLVAAAMVFCAAACSAPMEQPEPSTSTTGPDRAQACRMIREARLESLDETVSALLTVQAPSSTTVAVRGAGQELVETLSGFSEDLVDAADETDDPALNSATLRWADAVEEMRASVARAGGDPARIEAALNAPSDPEREIFDLCRDHWPDR